ncbi:MFS transporter [Enemella evansiae]|uniref:MFS transporter n=1 Tax=Enemella evansiae TaxID=2016499 RepID=A0A255G523_9ACTN|nr:MFS transporter [Enemella evansiae]OYO07944.1 MFS transporter [Enemella evansiae]
MTVEEDPRDVIARSRMRTPQIVIIVVATLVNMIDGFDLLVMAFSAPAVSREWAVQPAALGVLLSAALFGMAVGATALSGIADLIGRRMMILLGLSVVTLGMVVSALAPSYAVLWGARFVTGLAVGAVTTCVAVYVTEYTPRRWRAVAISWFAAGQPIGAMLGGLIAAALLGPLHWRGLFWVGAGLTALLVPVIFFALPESLAYLISKRPIGALEKVRSILTRLGHPPITTLPEPEAANAAEPERGSGTRIGGIAVLLGLAFFTVMLAFYFASSWTPRLVSAAGYTDVEAVRAGTVFAVGGILGTLGFGWTATRIRAGLLLPICFVVSAVAFVGFALGLGSIMLAYVGAFAMGIFTGAVIAGLFATAPAAFPARTRATISGLVIGAGRVGSVCSPILAGALLGAGWSVGSIYILFAGPLVVGAVACAIALRRPSEHRPARQPVATP